MDFSFKSIALFMIIIFPGIVFRRFFFQGEFTKQFNAQPWIQSVLYSVIPGVLIHTFLLFSIHIGYGLENIDFSPLENFYTNLKNQYFQIELIDFKFIGLTLLYYLVILLLSWLFAIIAWSIVRGLKLDSKYKVFRFHNYWNYYFKGEIKYFKEFQGIIDGKVLYVKADVMVNTDEAKPRLFNGELRQYTINKDNTLENIYLTNVKSYTGKRDEKGKPISKEIPGDCLILPYKNISNINLNYFANSKKSTNYSNIIIFFWLIFLVYLIASGHHILNSPSIFKTIVIKIFFGIYSFLIFALVSSFFEPKIIYDKDFIDNFDISKNSTNESLKRKFNLELEKKKKKMESKNAIYGILILIIIMTIIIYFNFF